MSKQPYNAIHFIGFTESKQYWLACQVFGQPDFIHVKWDTRVTGGGEYDPATDILVFAKGTEQDIPSQFAWNDSERF